MHNKSLYLRISTWRIGYYCALYIVIWAITPILSQGVLYRYIAVGAALIWFLTIFPRNRQRKLFNYAIYSILLITINFLTIGVFGKNIGSAIPTTINLFVFCMLGMISTYYFENVKEKFIPFALVVLVLYIIISVPSIIALRSNAYILRNASGIYIRTGSERYAGGYGYAFGCLFLIIFLTYDLRAHKQDVFSKTVTLFLIILFGYVVLNAGYTTALVLLSIGFFSALFFPKKNVVFATLIMIIAALILMMIVPAMLKWVVDNVELPYVYRAKIRYLSLLANSSGDVTYADSTRGALFYASLESMIKYPVLGSYILSGNPASGGHAVLLDLLVSGGVFYFIIYFYIVVLTPWRLMKEDKTLQIVYLTLIILLGLTDTFDYATMAIPLFIGPVIAERSIRTGKDNINEGSMVNWN